MGPYVPPLTGQALIDYNNATNARVYAQEQVYAQTPGTAAFVALRTPGTFEFNIAHNLPGNTPVPVVQAIYGNTTYVGPEIPQARSGISSSNTIPAPVIQTPPPQVGTIISTSTIPNPLTPSIPVQARQDTTIFSQAKPLLLVGVALFAAVTLFVTPKGSKRK